MKQLGRISTIFSNSGTLFLAMFLFAAVLLTQPIRAQQEYRAASLQERAMITAKLLREYHQRTMREAQQLKLRGASTAPVNVGIRLDRTLSTTSMVFLYDNMESGVGSWTSEAYSGTDLWHQTTTNASSPSHSWWAGVEQQGNYVTGARVNCALKSPAIDLTSAAPPVEMLFTENYLTEPGWDFCMVDVSTDGGITWHGLRGGYGSAPSGNSDGWMISSLNLSAYVGHNIIIRFHFDTGDSFANEYPGWFVDDVIIFDQGGMITGKKFFDANQNHVKDFTDRGIKDWLITATGPVTLTTKTALRGKFWLPLPLGTYSITEEEKPGWTQTFPEPFPSEYSITLVTPDTLVDSVWFGNFTNASFVNGIKFNDVDHSGTYNEGDSLLSGWKILLSDTLGNVIDYDFTDSLGFYELFVFQPGRYVVSEVSKKQWVQSYPPEESYTVDIPDLSTRLIGKDFGNYFSPLANSIVGVKFNDRNRNHAYDQDEQGVAGFPIRLWRLNNGKFHEIKNRITDSSGYYSFMNLLPDTYKVAEVIEPKTVGWWQSYPDSFYTIVLEPGGTMDNVNFGNYLLQPGSIGGMKFNDLDTSGTKEPGEGGLSGWTVQLSGLTVYQTSVSTSVETDGDGNYTFTGLWPGTYIVSEVFRTGWRQTYPPNFTPHFVTLGNEENVTGKDFGNVADENFSLSFRTFLPESLALALDKKGKHQPIKSAPDRCQFWYEFQNLSIVAATKLRVRFAVPIIESTLIVSRGDWKLIGDKKKVIEIVFDPPFEPYPNDSLVISGFGNKPTPQVLKEITYTYVDGRPYGSEGLTQHNYPLRWPMPNAINALSAGAGTMLKVGLGGPHSVVHPTWKEVVKSLVEPRTDRMHIGDPRCLGTFANSLTSIKRQQKYLTPTKGNNKLFAEAIALQANIKASDLGITPGGFGSLIFDEGGSNPFNGMSIRQIAGRLDEYMSSYKDTVGKRMCQMPAGFEVLDSIGLFEVIRKIDSSFSGPIDTVSFATGLVFKPVRPLSEVSYLRLDSSFAAMGTMPLAVQQAVEPDAFTLGQNYPNPFNPTTTIEFYLPQESFVTLKLYNTLGQEIATLIDRQEMEDGWNEFELSANAFSLASGVYYYRLTAETITDEDNPTSQNYSMVKKMVLIK